MSHWSMPSTAEKAEHLRKQMEDPMRARFAFKQVSEVAATESLFDRLEDAAAFGRERDVRGLISNWVSQLIFSWEDPRRLASDEAIEILSEIAARRYEGPDLFPELHRFGENQFRSRLREISYRPKEDSQWQVVAEEGGIDLFALSDDGEMYRFCRLDGTVLDIKKPNLPRYTDLFEPALEARP